MCIFMSANLKAIAWLSMIAHRTASFFRVVEGELVGRARDTERLSADGRTTGLEGRHRGLALGALALARPSNLLVELLLAAEETTTRDTTVFEHHLAGVAGANAHLLELLSETDSVVPSAR